ncbi:MAG: helix-turn-helix transcriptional regulator [Desulfobulbaceae bacterium]|nr:helix-turn-helix transcriptional regulator [Desulfobulbaceae bacterium]
MTLAQAASLLGTTSGNLSRIETGIQMPRVLLALRMADKYCLTLDEIYGAEGTRIKPVESCYMPFNPGDVRYDLSIDIDHETRA